MLLGYALQRRAGFYEEVALVWLTLALVVTVIGVLGGPWVHRRGIRRVVLERVLTAGAGLQLVLLLLEPPGMYLQISDSAQLLPFQWGIVAAGCLLLAAASGLRLARRTWFPMLLVVHFGLGIWLIEASPNPHIDVVTVHREAIAALLDGHNPYSITFANIYESDTPLYPEGMVVDQRVQFGLPYPPLSLLLVVPGALLGGDYRYANLAAMSLAGAAIGYSTPATVARLAATLVLFTPRVFFVLEQGWTEPVVVLLLALTVFCTLNATARTPLALGGLVAVKQYMVLVLPLALLLIPRPWWPGSLAMLWRVMAVALAVTLPFFVWDPPAFIRAVITLQIYEPFRLDSLSYLSFLARHLSTPPPMWAGLVPAVLAIALVLWKDQRTPAGFAAAVALVMFVVFAFGKKAFCNYYFFVIGALCCAAAASTHAGDANRESTDQSRSGPL